MAQTPTFHEVLAAAHDYSIGNMYTAIPGVVITVRDLGGMYLDVQPTIAMRSQDGEDVAERPPILNVPMHMPLTKEGGMSYPITVGTPVFLMFSMRGLDVWKRSTGLSAPASDLRKFDVRDCFAMPGVYPMSEAPNQASKRTLDHDPSDTVMVMGIGTGNECEVRLKADGRVIVNSPSEVIVNAPKATVNAPDEVILNTPETLLTGNLTVEGVMAIEGNGGSGLNTIRGNFDIVGSTLLHNGSNIGSTHRHTGVEAGPDTSGTPV